jgi:hypothetical protein
VADFDVGSPGFDDRILVLQAVDSYSRSDRPSGNIMTCSRPSFRVTSGNYGRSHLEKMSASRTDAAVRRRKLELQKPRLMAARSSGRQFGQGAGAARLSGEPPVQPAAPRRRSGGSWREIPDAFRIRAGVAERFRIGVLRAPRATAEDDVLATLEDAVEDDLGEVVEDVSPRSEPLVGR